MKKHKIFILFSAIIFSASLFAQKGDPYKADFSNPRKIRGMKLVWNDEFNVDGKPDSASWRYEKGFVRNQELQWYQEENAVCKDGVLLIEGRREKIKNPGFSEGSNNWKSSRESAEYSSSSIQTRGFHQWQFGRFEIRARIDTACGSWPAIWTLGTSGGWPAGGEIDIMEFYRVNGRPTILANFAWGSERRGTAKWDDLKKPFSDFISADPNWPEKFHVWRMDWDKDSIKLYLDNLLLNDMAVKDCVNPDGFNPFLQPHYLLLNLAIGGNGGDPSKSHSPIKYEVDWVRVYQVKQKSAAPSGLMVEFIRDPSFVKIMDLKPEFTWIVPQEAITQSSFQIIVSSSIDNCKEGLADVWDSGKKESSQSAEVEYGGESLQRNRTYFWKVRIRDSKTRQTPWSEIQSFTTGDPKEYSTTSNYFVSVNNPAVKLTETSGGKYLADFGKDAFGRLLLHLAPFEKDTLIIHLGEKLTADGHIDRNPGGTIRYNRVVLPVDPAINDYCPELPPDKRNTGSSAVGLPESFGVLTPFRYCEIENYMLPLKPENIVQKASFYFFIDDAAGFVCSDTVLNQVWNLCKYSIKATSFTGIYIDGDRERIPYEADAYINQLGHYYTDREYSMARRTNEYFISHPTWPTEWILQTVLMFYNDYMFTGNIESVRTYYNKLKHKTLTALARNDGLISSSEANDEIIKSLGFANEKERIRDIVDWPPAQKDTGWKLVNPEGERDGYDMVKVNTVVNAFYYRNLVLMSELAKELGKNDDAEQFTAEAARVMESFNRVFLNIATGIYVDGEASVHSSLHANMMALAFGLVPEENIRKVTEFIKSRGMACSVYGSQFLLEGLYRASEADYAFSLLTATNDRSWWNMIRSGSTITMEAWDMKYKPNSDWNHAWGAAPANIIPGYMWGIQPAEPGFAKAIIKPQLGNLKHSKITVPTIRGSITAEFHDTGKEKEYIISIPGNMECDLIISGNKTIRLKPGINKIKK